MIDSLAEKNLLHLWWNTWYTWWMERKLLPYQWNVLNITERILSLWRNTDFFSRRSFAIWHFSLSFYGYRIWIPHKHIRKKETHVCCHYLNSCGNPNAIFNHLLKTEQPSGFMGSGKTRISSPRGQVWNPLLRSLQKSCSTGADAVNSIEMVADITICWLN